MLGLILFANAQQGSLLPAQSLLSHASSPVPSKNAPNETVTGSHAPGFANDTMSEPAVEAFESISKIAHSASEAFKPEAVFVAAAKQVDADRHRRDRGWGGGGLATTPQPPGLSSLL